MCVRGACRDPVRGGVLPEPDAADKEDAAAAEASVHEAQWQERAARRRDEHPDQRLESPHQEGAARHLHAGPAPAATAGTCIPFLQPLCFTLYSNSCCTVIVFVTQRPFYCTQAAGIIRAILKWINREPAHICTSISVR